MASIAGSSSGTGPGSGASLAGRPPSVDALARSIRDLGLAQMVCVEIAREAIAAGDAASARGRGEAFLRTLLTPVVNATGVLLHTNLGRAPVGVQHPPRPQNVEFDLATGERGSRQRPVGQLLASLCGAEAAMVVNNNAAAVMLVLAALAHDRSVAVSRGESVEIGGAFRVPDVMEQSGALLVDVGTTNRTRLADYASAIVKGRPPIALTMKVHPSNFRIEGFVEDTSVADLATLDVPVVADIGSGLIDTNCPWLSGPPPAWLAGEPGARGSWCGLPARAPCGRSRRSLRARTAAPGGRPPVTGQPPSSCARVRRSPPSTVLRCRCGDWLAGDLAACRKFSAARRGRIQF